MAQTRRQRRKRRTVGAGRPDPAPDPAPDAPRAPDRAPAARPPQPRGSRRARMDDAPQAPWSPFPLVELTILAGIVLIVLGFTGVGGDRVAFVACGFALVTVASLELSLREHFAGYRSHSTLLAAAAAILAVVPLFFFTALPQLVLLVVGVAVFAAGFAALRAAFRRRTGGIGFRL